MLCFRLVIFPLVFVVVIIIYTRWLSNIEFYLLHLQKKERMKWNNNKKNDASEVIVCLHHILANEEEEE